MTASANRASKLLRDLRLLTCANIPELVLVTAHFSGLIKKIFLREATVIQTHDDGNAKTYTIRIPNDRLRGDDFIRDNWTSMEEVVNESFNAILLTLPPDALGHLVAHLFDETTSRPMYVTDPEWSRDISPVIGSPDIVLCDESKTYLYLIELKIQAKKSNGKYTLQQHTKYSNYIQAVEAEGKNARAALLAPSDDYKRCLVDREVAWFDFIKGKLSPAIDRIDGKPAQVSNKSVVDFQSFIEYQNKHIRSYGLDVNPESYRPIKYASFSRFKSALAHAAPHLVDAFSIIENNSSS